MRVFFSEIIQNPPWGIFEELNSFKYEDFRRRLIFLANFWTPFFHEAIGPTFISVFLLEVLLFFWLIKPPLRKVQNAVLTLARQVEVSSQPCAFHIVSLHNQTNEMSALLTKNMRQIDQQDGRSMAARYHHLAYSVL